MASLRHRLLLRLINLYPPYVGANIRTLRKAGDANTVVVRMGLTWFNKNLFGTQFGGSLYSMCDPHFLFIVAKNLGPDYIVWDKAATIDFVRPGRGAVRATFHIPPEAIEEIRAAADRGEKIEPVFTAEIVAEDGGEVVARVTKRLWVRKRDPSRT